MEFKLSDWIVNEGNIFQLDELELISIMAIQSEISSQVNLQNITTKKDFLTIKLDLSNRTFGTTDLSIEKILIEYLFIDIGSPTRYNMVCMVLDCLSFWLERKYRTNGSAPMYAMSQYKEHYESLKNDYCEQFLDAEETDFINAQLALCNALEKELQKPVYTEFDILEITETPCKFKQELTLTIFKRRAYLNEKLNSLSTTSNASKAIETKTDKFKLKLTMNCFFELPKVKLLSEPNKQNLVELITTNTMPYGIAMFNELGFCEFLDNEHGAKYKANKVLSRLYNEDAKDGTTARHYRHSLVNPTKRYNAKQYKEKVTKDYQNLK